MAMSEDILKDIHYALERTIAEGKGIFKRTSPHPPKERMVGGIDNR